MFKNYLESLIIYDEEYLLSQFSIGFELEAWSDGDLRDYKQFVNRFFKEGKTIKFIRDDQGNLVNPWDDDSTIEPDRSGGNIIQDCPSCGGDGFELEECGGCDGSGFVNNDCYVCDGDGTSECPNCYGSGKDPLGKSLFEENPDCPDCGGSGEVTCFNCKGKGTIPEECGSCNGTGEVRDECPVCDGSGQIRSEAETFEWASPIFNVTPENLSIIIDFLSKSVKYQNISTNDTCGFHIHIGFPDPKTVDRDMFWVLCQLAAEPDSKMLKEISYFNTIQLSESTYATFDLIDDLRDTLYNMEEASDYKYAKESDLNGYFLNMFDTGKYQILRQHPQGTLEWRGARGFLDSKRRLIIKKFILNKLYPFLKWISIALDKKTIQINDFIITRELFDKVLKTQPTTVKKTLRGTIYADRRFDMRIAGSLEITEKDIYEAFEKFPWLGKAKMEDAVFKIDNSGLLRWLHGSFNGTWIDGFFSNGDFRGVCEKGTFDNVRFQGTFKNGKFTGGSFRGDFIKGFFESSTFKDGQFINGVFGPDSTFEGGVFKGGTFIKSLFEDGTFEKGIFKESRFSGGTFAGGTFDKSEFIYGVWQNGKFLSNSKWRSDRSEKPKIVQVG